MAQGWIAMRAIYKSYLSAAFWLLLCGGYALSQQTLLHSGSTGPGGGGGAGLCGGSTIHMTAPNDLTNAAWTKSANVAAANAVSDPLGGTNASSLSTNSTAGGNFSASVIQDSQTINGNTTYVATAYFKSLTAPPWVLFGLEDSGGTNQALKYFNVSTGAVGNTVTAGSGNVSCAISKASSNGYVQVSVAGSFGANLATGSITFFLLDQNGGANVTLNQSVAGYQISP
jgi:hypothetical protein